MVFGFADDAEVDGPDELDFGGIDFAVDEYDLEGGVKAGGPVDGGGFSGSGGTVDDEGVGDEVIFES